MEYIEVSAKTVEDAITNACVKLATTSDNIEYEVIEHGSAGFLGMFSKPAVIKARIKAAAEEVKADVKEEKPKKNFEKPAHNKERKNDFKKEAKEDIKPKAAFEKKETADKDKLVKEASDKNAFEKKVSEKTESSFDKENSFNNEMEEKNSKYTTVMPKEEVERRIVTFLNDMFKAMDMEVNINVNFDDSECVKVELSGENMGVLIGKRGQTLDSIQYLTSLVVNKGKDKYVRIKLDTEDYRNRRRETLESLAKNIAYKVKRSRRTVSLEPMNPYERRIIHMTLQSDKFVSTRSEGEEPFRRVVVYLDKDKAGNARKNNNQ